MVKLISDLRLLISGSCVLLFVLSVAVQASATESVSDRAICIRLKIGKVDFGFDF